MTLKEKTEQNFNELERNLKEIDRLLEKREKRLRRNHKWITGLCVFMIIQNLILGFLNVMRDKPIWVLQFFFCIWFTYLLNRTLKNRI